MLWKQQAKPRVIDLARVVPIRIGAFEPGLLGILAKRWAKHAHDTLGTAESLLQRNADTNVAVAVATKITMCNQSVLLESPKQCTHETGCDLTKWQIAHLWWSSIASCSGGPTPLSHKSSRVRDFWRSARAPTTATESPAGWRRTTRVSAPRLTGAFVRTVAASRAPGRDKVGKFSFTSESCR